MRVLLTFSPHISPTTWKVVPEQRMLVILDAAQMDIPDSETPLDILLETLSDITFPKGSGPVFHAIETLSEYGFHHMRALVMPGAVKTALLQPLFTPQYDHEIAIRFDPDDKSDLRDAWLSIDGGADLMMGLGELKRAPDRCLEYSKRLMQLPRLFEDVHGANHDGRTRPDQFNSGSVLTGMYAALFDNIVQPSREALSPDHAALAGLLAWISGVSFDIRDDGEAGRGSDAIRAMLTQDKIFRTGGYLFTDRGWNPRTMFAGPRLSEALGAADPDTMNLGRSIFDEIHSLSVRAASQVLRQLAMDVGIDDLASLPRHPVRTPSRHEDIETQAHARRLHALYTQTNVTSRKTS